MAVSYSHCYIIPGKVHDAAPVPAFSTQQRLAYSQHHISIGLFDLLVCTSK